jgi:hypothetical protein
MCILYWTTTLKLWDYSAASEEFNRRYWMQFGVTSTYIDTKKGDAVAMVPAVGNVSHFLDGTTI